jgi:hypothetical protein
MTKKHKEALQEFMSAAQAWNAAGNKYGPNSTQADALWDDVVKKLGFALGMYKAMDVAGQIPAGSSEDKEHRFLIKQMQMILGK